MEENLRKTGIDIIGDAPWATHFCQFYGTGKDLQDILVPYFKAGLENNEYCMWITSNPFDVTMAEKALEEQIPDYQIYVERGQIEILPHSQWYLDSGIFDLKRVLNAWMKKLEQGLEKGFAGLRVSGNTAWLGQKDRKDFTEYEATINRAIAGREILVLCSYSLEQCSGLEIIDVVRNHEFALIRRDGSWEKIEDALYKTAKSALKKNEEQLREIFENSPIGVAMLDRTGTLTSANRACLEVWGVAELKQLKGYNLFKDPNLPPDVRSRIPRGESTAYETPFDFMKIKNAGLFETSKSGTSYLDFSITPLKDAGTGILSGYLMQVQDVTDSKEIEEYLARYNEQLELGVKKRTRELEKLNQVLSDEISQSKITREALRQSKAQLENLIDAMSEGVTLIDNKGIVITANPAMCRITGKALSSIEGHPYYEQGKRLYNPDFSEMEVEDLPTSKALKFRRAMYDVEMGLERNDGQLVWLRVNTVPLLDEAGNLEGVVRTLYDITERKRMQDNLRENEAHLRLLLNQLPCILWTTDVQLVYSLSLGAGLQTFNLYPNQIVGMSIFDYYNTSDPNFAPILAHRQALKGQPASYELYWEEKTLNCYVEPLRDNKGKIIGVIGISFDVTGKKQAEDALRALSRRLVDIQEEERRNIALELHDEIGQSMAALKFMLNQVTDSTTGAHPSCLIEAQALVTELIKQVRDLSLKLRPSMLDDLGLLPTLLWYIENYASQTSIKVGFEHRGLQRTFSPEINTAVYRIIQEALANVARHAKTLDVNISVWADECKIALKIEDHGRGFTSAALLSSSSTGIWGMRERLRMLDGSLNIESIPGLGTCLEVEIPLK